MSANVLYVASAIALIQCFYATRARDRVAKCLLDFFESDDTATAMAVWRRSRL